MSFEESKFEKPLVPPVEKLPEIERTGETPREIKEMGAEQKGKEISEKEPKRAYIEERIREVKNKLSEYFPNIYRETSTKLDYQDRAGKLVVKYFSKKDRITIKTPENLSGKTSEELKETKTDFLVFKKFAGNEKISKKIQDFFFLNHEYVHAINKSLIQELRPDLKFNLTNIVEKSKLIFQPLTHRNSIFMFLGEGLAVSMEKMMAEKMLKDPKINENDKKEIESFWIKHQESLASQKLEKSPESRYTELDGTMAYYKIYQQFGEKGVLDFIKNQDFEKLNKIKMYSDLKRRILSPGCREFLDMDGRELVENFTKKKKEK